MSGGIGRTWLYACWCMLLMVPRIHAQDPPHRTYARGDGMPSNTVYAMLQDDRGYMWFATGGGVCRFDGHTFRTLGLDDGMTDNVVLGLFQDSKGRIWFLTLNGRLCYWSDDRLHSVSEVPMLERFVARAGWQSCAEDGHGRLWFGSIRSDIACVDMAADTGRMWNVASGYMVSMVNTGHDEVVAVMSGRIATLENGEWTKHDSIASVDFVMPWVIAGADGRSPPVIVYSGGVKALRGRRWAPLIEQRMESRAHQSAFIDALGDLWVRRIDQGVDHYPRTDEGFGPPEHLFEGMVIHSVLVDDQGDHWFATARHGAMRCTENGFRSRLYRLPGSTQSVSVRRIARTGERLYIGTNDGHVHEVSGTMGFTTRIKGLGRVLEMAGDGQGRLWVASDNTLLRYGPRAGTVVHVPGKSQKEGGPRRERTGAKCVAVAPDGSVWSSFFGLYRVESEGDGMYRDLVQATAGYKERTHVLHVDRSGAIWFETNGELHMYDSMAVRDLGTVAGSANVRIEAISGWTGDTLLIGTSGRGLFKVVDGRVEGNVRERDGLLSDNVIRIRTAGDTLLVVSPSGLSCRLPGSGSGGRGATWIRVPTGDMGELSDACFTPDGLMVGTSEGLCRIELPTRVRAPAAPPLNIEGIQVNGQRVSPGRPVRLLERQDRLRVIASAISFAEPDRVEYQYRVDGGRWSGSEHGDVALAQMLSGDHVLDLRARVSMGPWCEPVVIPIECVARWWNRGLVRTAMGFLVLSVLFIAIWWYLRRRLRRQIAALKAREAVTEERRRIAAEVHDDLGADMSRLLMLARSKEDREGSTPGVPLSVGLASAIDKIDEIIWSLDPKRDSLGSTILFIEHQAREAVSAAGMLFRCHVDLPESDLGLGLGAKERRAVYLIAREALRNAIAHGKATMIQVRWTLAEGHVRLVIEDDGIGMAGTSGKEHRNGLRNMRERAGSLGAALRWVAVVPRGTRVELDLPLGRIIRSDDGGKGFSDGIFRA